MYTETQIKEDRGTVVYNGDYKPVEDFNEREQLFKITVDGKEIWIRAENYNYIPF